MGWDRPDCPSASQTIYLPHRKTNAWFADYSPAAFGLSGTGCPLSHRSQPPSWKCQIELQVPGSPMPVSRSAVASDWLHPFDFELLDHLVIDFAQTLICEVTTVAILRSNKVNARVNNVNATGGKSGGDVSHLLGAQHLFILPLIRVLK